MLYILCALRSMKGARISLQDMPTDCSTQIFGYLYIGEVARVRSCSRRMCHTTTVSFRAKHEIVCPPDATNDSAFALMKYIRTQKIRMTSLSMVRAQSPSNSCRLLYRRRHTTPPPPHTLVRDQSRRNSWRLLYRRRHTKYVKRYNWPLNSAPAPTHTYTSLPN